MASSTVFATKTRADADQFIIDRKGLGDNVIEISPTNKIEFWKDSVEQAPWNSGPVDDWILIIATPDKLIMRGKPD